MENYSWGQSIQEVYINVSVPPGTKPAFITVLIKKNRITIGIKNQDPIIDDDLFSGVIVDESFWSLEDKKTVTVLMTKQDRMDWWKSLLKGGPVIDTEMVETGPSKLSELDVETRSALEKMLFDRKQKALGLPTSGQIINEELTKKLIAQNPIIDYSGKDFMKGAAE
ncbi:UNVERIFIED_CONTAM: protein BOBBER 2 [Sesamum latifolium]|uniref:Protein BOBBER 2 n=1 Tax=Sesamum latifolium TaxID=2727402 RepID=A0AAW2XFM1_9LAMI